MKIEMTWTEGLEVLLKIGMTNDWAKKLADPFYSAILKRPTWNMFVFDDWLHGKFGDYELQDKSMAMIIHENFPNEEAKLKYMFGIFE